MPAVARNDRSSDEGLVREVESLAGAFGSPRILACVLTLALAAAAFLVAQGLQPSDDAYITFRHAKNLATHARPAWNLDGDPVMGSTSPAFVFGLGAIASVVGPEHIEKIALYANAGLLFGIVVLSYLVALDLLRRPLPALLAAALVGFNSVNVYVFSLGFEAALLVLLMLASLYAARRERDGWAVVLASATILVRPEGLLLAPVVWGFILVRKRFRARLVVAYLALPLLWVVFAGSYYGSPVPHSIEAKQKFPVIYRPYDGEPIGWITRTRELPASSVALWRKRAVPILASGTFQIRKTFLRRSAFEVVALLSALFLSASLAARRDDRLIYVCYPPLWVLMYAWIDSTMIWYLPSFVAFSVILVFAGCFRFLAILSDRTGLSRWKTAEILSVGIFLLLLSANSYTWNLGEDADPERAFLYARDPRGEHWEVWEHERYSGYRRAAEHLNEQQLEPGTVLINEVGVFGYFYGGSVIDAIGLCSPEALAFYPPPRWDIYDEDGKYRTGANNFAPTEMVLTLRPEYVVNSLTYVKNLLRPDSPFHEQYELIRSAGVAWQHPIASFRRTDTAPHPPGDHHAPDESTGGPF